MPEQQPAALEQDSGAEQLLQPPEIWVGSRDDYQTERRYGQWIDASQRTRDVLLAIRDVIDRTPDGLGQRWDICALRGFAGWRPSEQEGLPAVLEVARGISIYGPAYGGLVRTLGADSPAVRLDRFKQAYLGSWPSVRAFVEQAIAESGWCDHLAKLPTSMQPYVRIDTNKAIRDTRRELTFATHNGGVWVYDPRFW